KDNPMRKGLLKANWLKFYALLYLGFLYLPIIFLPIFSINSSPRPSFPLTGYTTAWYRELIGNQAMLSAAKNSLLVGLGAAIISTVFGICAARALTRYMLRGQ